MRRLLLPSKAFVRLARQFTRKHPQQAVTLRLTLELLGEDAFHAQLKTHKLRGRFSGSWACSAGYDARIVFQFVKQQGAEAILLEAVGSHDEVY